MPDSGSRAPQRFQLIATYLAGRPVAVAEIPPDDLAYTDGQVVFVPAGRSVADQRREVLVQAALLGAGSLDPPLVKRLRGRRTTARRYLALEARRVLRELDARVPLAPAVGVDEEPITATAEESLDVARSRAAVTAPPPWFGDVRPARLLRKAGGSGSAPTDEDMELRFDIIDLPEETDDEDDEGEEAFEDSKVLKLLQNPILNSTVVSDFLRKMSEAPGTKVTTKRARRCRCVRYAARNP